MQECIHKARSNPIRAARTSLAMSDAEDTRSASPAMTSSPPSHYASPLPGSSTPTSPISPSVPLPNPPRSKTAPPLPPPEDGSASPFDSPPTPGASTVGEAPVSPTDPLALRRTSSALSSGSSSSRTTREKKRLRFTPVANGEHNGGASGYDLEDMEEGMGRRTIKGKGVARDQADYLKSDPGTPNLSET